MTVTLTERLTSNWTAGTTCGVLFPAYPEERPGSSEPLLTENHRRDVLWVNIVSPLPEELMSYRSTEVIFPKVAETFVPRTALGRKLLSLRNRAIKEGMKLLSADEVLEEVKRRRGEIEGDETDIY